MRHLLTVGSFFSCLIIKRKKKMQEERCDLDSRAFLALLKGRD